MIRNMLVLMGAFIVAAVVLTEYTDFMTSPAPRGSGAGNRIITVDRSAADERTESQDQGNTLVFNAGPHGHFFVDASVDGESINFLVDTGASLIALTRDDAERMGLNMDTLQYSARVKTANGTARVAPITLREVAIDDIVVENVRAVVVESPMQNSLLGMSFLRRLDGFEVRDNQLILRW